MGSQQGSGVIVSPSGLVLTLASLVGKGTTPISVTLNDKRSLNATIWGLDEYRNLAMLRVQATGLPAATMGDSSKLTLGQNIVVVGYDSGTTSPTARLGTFRGTRTYATTGLEYLETDATAGAGSQGGPVVNPQGQVVGLYVSPSPFGFPGIYHAAASNSIGSYVDKLKLGAWFFKPTPFSSFPPCSTWPPFPAAYSGTVTVDGKPAPSGTQVIAIVTDFVTGPATVSAGSYKDLVVGPPCGTYEGAKVTFYVDGFAAAETKSFKSGDAITVNLTVTTPTPP